MPDGAETSNIGMRHRHEDDGPLQGNTGRDQPVAQIRHEFLRRGRAPHAVIYPIDDSTDVLHDVSSLWPLRCDRRRQRSAYNRLASALVNPSCRSSSIFLVRSWMRSMIGRALAVSARM